MSALLSPSLFHRHFHRPLRTHSSFFARRSSRSLSSSFSSSTSIWSSSKPSSSSSPPPPPYSSSSHVARRGRSSSSSLSSIRSRQLDYPQPLLRPPPTPPPLHHHLCCSSPSSSSLHRLGLCAGLLRAPEQLLCHRASGAHHLLPNAHGHHAIYETQVGVQPDKPDKRTRTFCLKNDFTKIRSGGGAEYTTHTHTENEKIEA